MIITRSGFFKRGYNLAAAYPSGATYPNLPLGYNTNKSLNFSQAIPPLPDNIDRPIDSNWSINQHGGDESEGGYWSRQLDVTAPNSPPDIWKGHFSPGVYPTGHGLGAFFATLPNVTRLYMSVQVYFDFSDSEWQTVSDKLIFIQGNNGSVILIQLFEAPYWRHGSELKSGNSFYIDPGASSPGELHIPGQLSNGIVPTRQWVQLEVLVDLAGVFKIWQNGVLTTSATPTFAATQLSEFKVSPFRGGGGETILNDLYWKFDSFYIAW